jgi:hypothetical protein
MAGQELVLRFMAFKTLDEDEFKTMNRFLDLAMEEIDFVSWWVNHHIFYHLILLKTPTL